MSVERPCEICGSQTQTHLYEVNGFPVVRCRECGLVFIGRRPRPEELLALYDEAYYEDSSQPGYNGYAEAEARKRHHDRTLLREIETYRRPGQMIEIGCAYGYFLDEARRRGWGVRGIEPSAHAARHARERFGLDVGERPFTEMPVEPESLDAVVLWDVIEHLSDPRETVDRAAAWLRPGGVLALSTGNVASLAARLHGADWSLMTPPWHQFYFSPITIRRLLAQTGFEVLRVGGDGSVAVDPASARPRVPRSLAPVLRARLVTKVARRLGAGSILFAYGRK